MIGIITATPYPLNPAIIAAAATPTRARRTVEIQQTDLNTEAAPNQYNAEVAADIAAARAVQHSKAGKWSTSNTTTGATGAGSFMSTHSTGGPTMTNCGVMRAPRALHPPSTTPWYPSGFSGSAARTR